MTGRDCDIAIVGGGLAGGLIALALRQRRPDKSVRLIEGGPALGGHHRWSWFESDLTLEGRALMDTFPAARWDGGYEVAFPDFTRHLRTPYRSLASADFAATLGRLLPEGTVHADALVASLAADAVMLESGERIAAGAVIDCRGFAPTPHLSGGWQVFMGRRLRTTASPGVERPIIMDATVDQLGGYRFVYVLPLGPSDLFVEDTYYQDAPLLDRSALSARLDAYCDARGWQGETAETETGVLPVITGGDFGAWQAEQRIEGVAVAGARGGFGHPLTSYTVPFATATALAIAAHADLAGPHMAEMLERRAREHWRTTRLYRRLGAMLFAARPEQRRGVFARFYRLDAGLIERFYAARSTWADRARILCGKPPVPLGRAIGALASPQSPLRPAA